MAHSNEFVLRDWGVLVIAIDAFYATYTINRIAGFTVWDGTLIIIINIVVARHWRLVGWLLAIRENQTCAYHWHAALRFLHKTVSRSLAASTISLYSWLIGLIINRCSLRSRWDTFSLLSKLETRFGRVDMVVSMIIWFCRRYWILVHSVLCLIKMELLSWELGSCLFLGFCTLWFQVDYAVGRLLIWNLKVWEFARCHVILYFLFFLLCEIMTVNFRSFYSLNQTRLKLPIALPAWSTTQSIGFT